MIRRLAYGLGGLGAATLLATAAQAGVVASYPTFCPSTGLTFVGNAGVTGGCQLQLTSSGGGEAGAAYSTTPITLGANDTFSTTFSFQITNAGGIDPADGIVFVLAASPTGLGNSGGDIGYGGVPNSVGIEFDTYDNGSDDGDSSNHVAIDESGNINNGSSLSDQNLTFPYGQQTCDFGSTTLHTRPGCLSNGDVWSAVISYNGTDLSLSVTDPAEGFTDVIYNDLPIDIASFLGTDTAYVGFTGGTGSGYEQQNVTSFEFANDTSLATPTPEPASLAIFGGALIGLGLGLYRRRRRKPS